MPDVRKYLSTLGENPVDAYYSRAKSAQEKMSKKANMFGMFGAGPGKKEQREG